MRKIIHLILIVLLLVPCSALQASHQPEFSTAGFFELPNSGREVFSMNPAWRFYKGSVAGAEAISFDDTEWAVVSLPDRKSTRLNSSHRHTSRMPSSA